jgi:hypothetical protein
MRRSAHEDTTEDNDICVGKLWEDLMVGNQLEELGADERIVFILSLNQQDQGAYLYVSLYGHWAGRYETGKNPRSVIKCRGVRIRKATV